MGIREYWGFCLAVILPGLAGGMRSMLPILAYRM